MPQFGRRSSQLDGKQPTKLTDLDERRVERYLRHRGGRQSIQPGDRAALKRWLSALRDAGAILPAALPPICAQDQIFAEFSDYLRRERGPAQRTIVSHLPAIRRFLSEVCPAGADDLGRISQEDVTGYIERHARDWSPKSGKAMCWSLRAFLRYLHHKGRTRFLWPAACPRSDNGSSRACRPIFPVRRLRRSLMVAIEQPPWGGGTTPS